MKTKNKTTIIAEPGKQEVTIIREFDAPRELVFKAFKDPELLVQWLGPKDMTLEIEKYDCRTGGAYRLLNCSGSGHKFNFNGVMHEVTEPERMIRTFEFEGLPERGHVSLEAATFTELPGNRTKLTIHCVFLSLADRDGMVQSGMEGGVVVSHQRLDELFEKMLVK
jgi:uncharacterized protein YndB with AHSA1/START domain